MHLLIIEDDIDLGLALQSALRPEGFTCRWVRKLADAVASPGEEVDCAVPDLFLPDGDGLDLPRRWRAAGQRPPQGLLQAMRCEHFPDARNTSVWQPTMDLDGTGAVLSRVCPDRCSHRHAFASKGRRAGGRRLAREGSPTPCQGRVHPVRG